MTLTDKSTSSFKIIFTGLLLNVILSSSSGQNCNSMNFQLQSSIPSVCTALCMTMMHDDMGRPFLYVANKEAGLKIYDITNLATPQLVRTISISDFDSLEVMNVSQDGNYLYLAVGNTFAAAVQHSGMAIVDVTNPLLASVTSYWELNGPIGGSGIVKAAGNYAYLGAMGNGLIILDITNKSSVSFVSQYLPNLSYPEPNPDTPKYNARGMEVIDDIVYLCFDAGGLRIINVTDKNNPVETGYYSNPLLLGLPRAYNNIVIDDSLAYIAVDYCGMEVLNISDTSNITLTGWWNPYNCPGNNWFTSPVHANEIRLNKNCKEVFLATGKSDLHVVDVSNPASPDSCNFYGGVSNNTGTWGVGLFEDQVYLSYICNPLPFPFPSSTTSVEILSYTNCSTGMEENEDNPFSVYPNPATNDLVVESAELISGKISIVLSDITGNEYQKNKVEILNDKYFLNISELNTGIYFMKLICGSKTYNLKFSKF